MKWLETHEESRDSQLSRGVLLFVVFGRKTMRTGLVKCVILFAFSCVAGNTARSQERVDAAKLLSLDSLLNIKISTASRSLQTVSEAPASVTIVTAEDIDRYGYRTLDEVLTTLKGFYRSYDRNYMYAGVRGFSRPTDYNDRLLLLLNGHVMNDNFYGSAPIGTDFPFPFESIDRIEVVRGPGSALYGTGGMFAVINIVTKPGSRIDGLRLSAETGSFGRMKGSLLAGTQWDNGLDAAFSASWANVKSQDLYFEQFDDPATNHGIARGVDWDRYYSIFGDVRYHDFSLKGFYSSRNKGVPTASFGTLFNDERSHTVDGNALAELKYEREINPDKAIIVKASYFNYRYEGEYPYSANSYDKTDADVLEGDLQFRWDLMPNNQLIIGAEFRHNTTASYRYWDMNTTYFDSDYPYDVLSFYIQDEFQVRENLLLTLGLRHDKSSISGTSTTPRAAVVYNPFKSSTLKMLYGEGFRAPNLYEAHYFDPISGFKSNPALRPEKVRTLEAVWEQRMGSEFFASISLYRYFMDDLIDTWIDPADSLTQFQNISRVDAFGAELDFEARLHSGVTGYANYTFQDARDSETDQQLSNMPAHLVHLGFGCSLSGSFEVAVEMQYETGRKTVYGTTTDPFLITNMNLTAHHFLGNLTASFSIRNLFNTSYSNPGGFEHKQPSIPQDGRNFLVKFDYFF